MLSQLLGSNPYFSSEQKKVVPGSFEVDKFLQLLNALISHESSPLVLPSECLFVAALYQNSPTDSIHNPIIQNIEVRNENRVQVFCAYPDPLQRDRYVIKLRLSHTTTDRVNKQFPMVIQHARLEKVAAAFEVVKRGRRLIGAGVGRILDGLTLAHDMHLILDLTASPSDFAVLPATTRASNPSFEYQLRRVREAGLQVRTINGLIDLCLLMRIVYISNMTYLDHIVTQYVSRSSSNKWLEDTVGRSNIHLFADIFLPEHWDADKVRRIVKKADAIENRIRLKRMTSC